MLCVLLVLQLRAASNERRIDPSTSDIHRLLSRFYQVTCTSPLLFFFFFINTNMQARSELQGPAFEAYVSGALFASAPRTAKKRGSKSGEEKLVESTHHTQNDSCSLSGLMFSFMHNIFPNPSSSSSSSSSSSTTPFPQWMKSARRCTTTRRAIIQANLAMLHSAPACLQATTAKSFASAPKTVCCWLQTTRAFPPPTCFVCFATSLEALNPGMVTSAASLGYPHTLIHPKHSPGSAPRCFAVFCAC